MPRGRGYERNETKHDQYVLDASKQTNSLVTASATSSVPSACLLAYLLARSQTTIRHITTPKDEDAIFSPVQQLGEVHIKRLYTTHIHTFRQDQIAFSAASELL
jgi:5-enolpyruvylshikimate-3-phosphate synthase